VTSANRHGEPPCTSAADLRRAFEASEVVAVLDGGDCDGLASTVIDCSGKRPTCVRDGAVAWSEIEAVLG
jgi:tRNA A37 threonylcarbamoyladenosine synthetase subunit TsaC/SUA5/YrdC